MLERTAAVPPAYGDWAALYHRFRPAYPPEVFAYLRDSLGESRLAACIELGSGSGQATADLAAMFAKVEAVEPEGEMAGRMPPLGNVRVSVGRAEDARFPNASADAVVAASAFHWMERDLVISQATAWLRPGGAFYVFGYGGAGYPQAPARLSRLLMRYAQMWRPHVHERLAAWRPYGESLVASGAFAEVRTREFYAEHRWSAFELAGFLMSTSYGQSFARESGDAEARLSEMAGEVSEAAAGRPIRVRFPVEAALGLVQRGPDGAN